jgi:hypothetical protein
MAASPRPTPGCTCPEHRVQLAAADRDLWLTLKPLLDAEPCNPPRVRDVARATGVGEDSVRALFKRIARHRRSLAGGARPLFHRQRPLPTWPAR